MAHIVIHYQAHAYTTKAFLDMFECAAAAGNVGHSCTLLISGQGVTALSLQPEQFSEVVHGKNTGKMLNSLPLYDVDEIFILQDETSAKLIKEHALADSSITWVDAFPTPSSDDILIHF